MKKSFLIGGGILAGLYFLYQQGVSSTPDVGDPGDTNQDGSATGGTDAGVIDQIQVALNLVPDYVNAWADAITIHEGWAVGSRSFRNNNPGNLEITGDAGVDAGGYGIFSSYNAGRNALVGDLAAKVRKYGSWTVYAVMARYAPPSQNNTQAYAAAVARALGVGTTTQVSAIAGVWASQGLVWQPVAFDNGGSPTGNAAASDPTLFQSDPSQQLLDLSSLSSSDLTTMALTDLAPLDLSGDSGDGQ